MTVLKLKSKVAAAPAQNNHILFPTMPLELRELIYFYALADQHQRSITISAADAIHGSPLQCPYYLPKLCRVNEATRIDVGLWFIRTTEFGLLYPHHAIYFAQFLSTFPENTGFASIRRLDFQLFGRHVPQLADGVRDRNAYIDFMKRCTGLTQVRIKFEMWYLLRRRFTETNSPSYWAASPWTPEPLSVEGIVELYRLDDLFQLTDLTELTIEVWPKAVTRTAKGVLHVTPNCWPVMEKLAVWIRNGFAERGRKVSIVLSESSNSGLRWAGEAEIGMNTGA
ncbi:hypothetical protein BDU57DRAFT_573259 [Ampelomyces quisqualis]|uniref:Uncharacterized protein n=1 Tax=Ampelomyces quisqualis TaxID=50730 RepID=A0A6A5QMZ9_AMPQU|nr:hypothetical protein BDU57DRAFT_573259 [Ampelomyces quisqualis]